MSLHEMGIDSFILAPPLGDAGQSDIRDRYARLTEEVIPAIRASAG